MFGGGDGGLSGGQLGGGNGGLSGGQLGGGDGGLDGGLDGGRDGGGAFGGGWGGLLGGGVGGDDGGAHGGRDGGRLGMFGGGVAGGGGNHACVKRLIAPLDCPAFRVCGQRRAGRQAPHVASQCSPVTGHLLLNSNAAQVAYSQSGGGSTSVHGCVSSSSSLSSLRSNVGVDARANSRSDTGCNAPS